MNEYDKAYFEDGIISGKSLYSHYTWLPDLTLPMAHELIEDLPINKTDKVLDFGCAKGYLVKALKMLGRDSVWGFDVSAYAIESSPEEIRGSLCVDIRSFDYLTFDWILAKDVLEHIQKENVHGVLEDLAERGRRIFAIVPLGDGERFNVNAYENDITHHIRESLDWWAVMFERSGFLIDYADYSWGTIKQNWSMYEKANGFLIAKSANFKEN